MGCPASIIAWFGESNTRLVSVTMFGELNRVFDEFNHVYGEFNQWLGELNQRMVI
jgi:hypothetical protein